MKSKLLLILSCLTAVHAWAANATVADLYNAANQRIGADTYTFFNFVPANPRRRPIIMVTGPSRGRPWAMSVIHPGPGRIPIISPSRCH